MNNNVQEPTLNEFCNALVAMANIEAKIKQTEIDKEFIEKIKFWSTGLFRIVVMGEIKKGKSSFINALLGEKDLVPVSSDVATSTIYKICYGEKISYKVFFTQESKKQSIEITANKLSLYGTEQGNPNNEKSVDFIQVFVPSPFLKNGLVIIDTPGLGGLFKQHKKITYEYVPRADAVFMVSDSVESPIGQAELELLEDLRKITDQIFFVQTKAMAVGSEERKAREINNRNILTTSGNFSEDNLKYFVVDSYLKLEADQTKDPDDLYESGFAAVAAFINNEIRPNVKKSIMKNALRAALYKYEWIKAQIEQMEKICSADNEDKQNELKEQLAKATQELLLWQNSLPMLQEKFQDGIRTIKEKAQEELKQCRPNGPMQMNMEETISNAQDMNELLVIIDELSAGIPNVFAEYRFEILKNIQEQIKNLWSIFADYQIQVNNNQTNDKDTGENVGIFTNVGTFARIIEQNANNHEYSFDNLRTSFLGGSIAVAMVTSVMDLFNPVGWVFKVIGTASAIYGGYKAMQIKQDQELKNAKNQAIMGLNQAFNSAYQSVLDSIQTLLNHIEIDSFKSLKKAIAEQQNNLKENEAKLKKRQVSTVAQLQEDKVKIEQYKIAFENVTNVLNSVKE